MADAKLPALTELTAPASGDLLYVVDVSDTTDDATGSSRKATVQTLLGVYNVRQHGATGDGSTDDTTALQAAIDAAEAAGGGTVYVPTGTYRTSGLTIGDGVTLCGEGHLSLIKGVASMAAPVLKNDDQVNGNSDIVVRDLAFDGNKSGAGATDEYNVLDIENVTRCRFENLYVKNGRCYETLGQGVGLSLRLATYCHVSNLLAEGNEWDGLQLSAATYCTVNGVNAVDNGRAGIQVTRHPVGSGTTESHHCTITNTTVYHTNGTPSTNSPRTSGLYIHRSDHITFSGFSVYGTQEGIGFIDGANENVFDCGIVSPRYSSTPMIYVEGGGTGGTNRNRVSNVLVRPISGANGKLVQFSTGTHNVLENITFDIGGGTGTWTITLDADATDNEIRHLKTDETLTITNSGARNYIDSPQAHTLTDGATVTWDLTKKPHASVTLGGDRTLEFTAASMKAGSTYTLRVIQDATGTRLMTWPATVKWAGATAPTLTTTAGRSDVFRFYCDGTYMYGETVGLNYTTGGSSSSTAFSGSGSPPTGWTAEWVTANVTYTEGSGYLRAAVSSTGRHAISWDTPGDSLANVEILAKVRTDTKAGSGDAAYCTLVARGSGSAASENGYAARMFVSSGTGAIDAIKYVSGTLTTLTGSIAVDWSADTWYWIRLRVNGTAVQVRAWADGGSEPGTWGIDTTDSSLSSGWIGYGSFYAGNADCDFFSYATDGDTAPGP